MLKILETKEEALELVEYLASKPALSVYDVGLGGSFATNMNKRNSTIDIVLKLKEGEDKSHIGSVVISAFVMRECEPIYFNKVQVLWLDLLEQQEVAIQEFVKEVGLDNNPYSVYANLGAETCWVEEEETDTYDGFGEDSDEEAEVEETEEGEE